MCVVYKSEVNAEKKDKTWLYSKQWLLAGKFSEFEYSPEICHFWRVRVLAKPAIFRNMRDSPDSPTFAKPCCADSPDSPRFAKSCCEDLPDLHTFAKPCCADSPDLRKTSLASATQIQRVWGEGLRSASFDLINFIEVEVSQIHFRQRN
jgi:hypothetical protein